MDWRRVLAWLAAVVVLAAAIGAIVRVATMAFGGAHRGERAESGIPDAGQATPRC